MTDPFDSKIKLKTPRPYSDQELLAEIFGFVPTKSLDDMFNLANILFYKVMEGTADRLITLRPDKLREINTALEKYERKTEMKLDQLFNTLQEYTAQDIWKIPKDLDIQLDQHKNLTFNISEKENKDLDAHLEKMRESIIAQKKFKALLNRTHNDLKQENSKLDHQLQSLSFLNEIPKQENLDMNEAIGFVKNQIEAYQNSVSESISLVDENQDLLQDERSKLLRSKIEFGLKRKKL